MLLEEKEIEESQEREREIDVRENERREIGECAHVCEREREREIDR